MVFNLAEFLRSYTPLIEGEEAQWLMERSQKNRVAKFCFRLRKHLRCYITHPRHLQFVSAALGSR